MWFGSENTIVIDITSNTFEQNILTLAEAKGYVAATSTSKIIVNIASGVTGPWTNYIFTKNRSIKR
jgi:hypothetical protein